MAGFSPCLPVKKPPSQYTSMPCGHSTRYITTRTNNPTGRKKKEEAEIFIISAERTEELARPGPHVCVCVYGIRVRPMGVYGRREKEDIAFFTYCVYCFELVRLYQNGRGMIREIAFSDRRCEDLPISISTRNTHLVPVLSILSKIPTELPYPQFGIWVLCYCYPMLGSQDK